MIPLTYDDEKIISKNIDKIITAVSEILNLTVNESNFKEWKDDSALIFEFRNIPIILEYNKYFGKYMVLTETQNEDNIQFEIKSEAISLYNICSKIKVLLCEIDEIYHYDKHKISNNIDKCIKSGKKYLNITLDKDIHFRDYYDDFAIYFTFNLQQFRITYDYSKRKYMLGHKNSSGKMKHSSDAYHNDGECRSIDEIFNRASTRHNAFKRGQIGYNTRIDDLYKQIKNQ